MTNEELVIRIQNEGDPEGELMLQLWNQNQRFVSMMANRYRGMAEVDDLEMEGYISLCAAVDKWRPGRPFLNYAAYWIKQGMVRYIEKNQQISISMQSKVRQMRRFVEEYEQDHGEKPQNGDICAYMDITEDQLQALQNAENKTVTASLNAPYSEDEELSLADVVPGVDDPEADAVDAMENQQLHDVIWPLVDALPGSESEVLHRRYENEETLQEIADSMGKKLTQVSDDQRRALTELRAPQNSEQLRPFWDDSEIRSAALQGNGIGSFNRSWTSSTEKTAIRMIEKSGVSKVDTPRG